MKVLIVIPHYGSNDHLRKLLPSIGVNIEKLDEALDNIRLVAPTWYGEVFIWNNNLRNFGFTKACNEGIRYGVNAAYDVIWLLNNDTFIPDIKKAIQELEEEFDKNPNTGVVGFKILSMDDPDFIHHGGTGACVPSGVHKVGRVSMGALDTRTIERWVTGASMAISSGCLMEVGLLDEKMVNYGSDSDFCYRARYCGYRVVYLPIPVLHKIGQSQNPSEAQQRVLKSDMLQFHSKWLIGKTFHDLDTEIFPEVSK